jgi:hypothetical protein
MHERDGDEAERVRVAFFRRTRRPVRIFYVVLGVATIGFIVWGLLLNAVFALVAFCAVTLVMLVLYVVGLRVGVTPRTSRRLVVGGTTLGVISVTAVDVVAVEPAVVLGGFSGVCAGGLAGVAAIRRRLACDDALILRQRALGWEVEEPSR